MRGRPRKHQDRWGKHQLAAASHATALRYRDRPLTRREQAVYVGLEYSPPKFDLQLATVRDGRATYRQRIVGTTWPILPPLLRLAASLIVNSAQAEGREGIDLTKMRATAARGDWAQFTAEVTISPQQLRAHRAQLAVEVARLTEARNRDSLRAAVRAALTYLKLTPDVDSELAAIDAYADELEIAVRRLRRWTSEARLRAKSGPPRKTARSPFS